MSHERARMTTNMLGTQCAVYVHDDRIEIGTLDPAFMERLQRVSYRDARRLLAWTSTRKVHLGVGVGVMVLSFLLVLAGVLAAPDPDAAVVLYVLAGGLAIAAVPGLVMGRPGGITRFRVEGVRGSVQGVLSGSRKKRDALLDEIERRIRDRQSPR